MYFGTGGKENDLKIWSIEELMKNEKNKSKTVIFQAKNVSFIRMSMIDDERIFFFLFQVRPNAFRLRMPVWVTDLQFIDERNRCLVSTGHHQVGYSTSIVRIAFYPFLFNRFAYMIHNLVPVDLFMKLNSNSVQLCHLPYFIHRITSS